MIAIDFYKFVFVNNIFFDIHFIVYHVVVSKFIVFLFIVFVNSNVFDENFSMSFKKINIIVIHKRFEYLFEKHLKRFSKIFKKLRFTRIFQFCEKCVFVKQIKRNFIIKSKRYKTRCNRIHMNFNDSHSISIKKKRYFLLFMNKATRFRWIYFLKQKSNVSNFIKKILILIKTQIDFKIKRWHFNNEKKFIFNVMTNIVKSNKIMHKFTIFYNLE